MKLVIGVIALLVLGSLFGSIAGLIFWPTLPSVPGASVGGTYSEQQDHSTR